MDVFRLLWLSGNPFCEGVDEETYRLSVLRILPNLLKLDSTSSFIPLFLIVVFNFC